MRPIRDPLRRAGLAIAGLTIALAATACGGSTPASAGASFMSPSSTAVAAASPSVAATEATTDAPAPTAVPGGETVSPGPPATHKPTTTNTDWGVILDAVPDDFPRYPGAKDTEADEPVSAALVGAADVETVASWYRDALEAAGYQTVDLSEPLEDGSRVLDSQADLPECMVQTTFRPQGGSTMITVLFAAGCVAIGG
jgi:hypothetical protein